MVLVEIREAAWYGFVLLSVLEEAMGLLPVIDSKNNGHV
jgi:hypothetical protein